VRVELSAKCSKSRSWFSHGRQWRPLDQALAAHWHEPSRCDRLFITLRKSEALFSPSTRRYRDLGPAGVVTGDGVGGLRPARLGQKG